MPVTYAARHVLEDHISGFEATPNPHHLAILRAVSVFSVLAHPGHEADIDEALTNLEDTHLRQCGPGEWLVVSDSVTAETIERQLRDLAPRLSFVDQSDGRVVLAIRGPRVRSILAKCLALDLPEHSEGWVREVYLRGHGEAWVFARSVAARSALQGDGLHMDELGSRSLGELLFCDQAFQRRAIEVCHYPQAWLPEQVKASTLWGRRSRFDRGSLSVLVAEVFLPALWRTASAQAEIS